MMYSIKAGYAGFYYMDTASAREATFQQTGLDISDFEEISDEKYAVWCNPPDGYYAVFDEKGPRVEKIPATDYIVQAEDKRATLLSEANQATYSLNLKLMMGRKLTASEAATVNAWLDYSDALSALDLSGAPDIEWPEKPA